MDRVDALVGTEPAVQATSVAHAARVALRLAQAAGNPGSREPHASVIGPMVSLIEALRAGDVATFAQVADLLASAIVPTLTGRAFPHPRAVDRGLLILHAGVALRLLQVLAPSGAVQVLYLSGLSGFLVVLGFLPWAYNLICLATPEPPPSGPITGHTRISDILARSPRHLTVLVEHGFGALANPVLRRSLARLVTLEDACRLHRIELDRVLAALRELDEPPAGGVLSPR